MYEYWSIKSAFSKRLRSISREFIACIAMAEHKSDSIKDINRVHAQYGYQEAFYLMLRYVLRCNNQP